MSSPYKTYLKDPDAVSDYTRSWVRWLAAGDTIQSSSWTVTGGLVIQAESNDDETATVWVSGGTPGVECFATNTITTVGGRTDDRTIRILVRER